MPHPEGMEEASGVLGVTQVVPRVWGVVRGPAGPLTVVGQRASHPAETRVTAKGLRAPGPGEAVVGPGGEGVGGGAPLVLQGTTALTFIVVEQLSEQASLYAHDLVVVTEAEARTLLGLQTDEVSDLAISVFHDSEVDALLPDLAAAFNFPVRLVTRAEVAGIYEGSLNRRGGLAFVTLVPALLALALLVLATARELHAQRGEAGLLKSLGWTTGDLFRLYLGRSLLILLPSLVVGVSVAWGLVRWPGIHWPGLFLQGWQTVPPSLHLTMRGGLLVSLELFGLLFVPSLIASALPALKSAAADPMALFEGENFG